MVGFEFQLIQQYFNISCTLWHNLVLPGKLVTNHTRPTPASYGYTDSMLHLASAILYYTNISSHEHMLSCNFRKNPNLFEQYIKSIE